MHCPQTVAFSDRYVAMKPGRLQRSRHTGSPSSMVRWQAMRRQRSRSNRRASLSAINVAHCSGEYFAFTRARASFTASEVWGARFAGDFATRSSRSCAAEFGRGYGAHARYS